MIKNLWKDPVWSKVIAAIIISIGAFLISLTYSLITKLSVKESFIYLWKYQIPLGPTILVLFILYVLISITIYIKKRRSSNEEKLEDLFHKQFNKVIDNENKITYRFNAYIHSLNKFPFISDLRIYCNNHNSETLMNPHKGCNQIGCIHYNMGYNNREIKQNLETYLLGEWEKMNI